MEIILCLFRAFTKRINNLLLAVVLLAFQQTTYAQNGSPCYQPLTGFAKKAVQYREEHTAQVARSLLTPITLPMRTWIILQR
jgi:hypothetical protein